MANLSQIQVGGTTYDICDTTARNSISQIDKFYTTSVTLSGITYSSPPVMYFRRWAYFVSVILNDVVNAATASTSLSVGTVPQGYLPFDGRVETVGGAAVSNNSFSGYYKWFIYRTGDIRYLTSVTGAREAPFNMTYYCNDAYPAD